MVEDEHQFVLSCRIMWTESDVNLAPEFIEDTQGKFQELEGCNFDKGFWSPRRKATLDKLPNKGLLTRKLP